jgi:Tol biopolymer transport system component
MSAERWQELERIFVAARALPQGERAAFVASSCNDATLRTEALSLLAADDASDDFMAEPALALLAKSFAAHGASFASGERIGAYTIVGLLGSGGVGEVWRARDERLDRDVAIKVLLPHLATEAGRLRRFAEEARAAGSLNSPNILTVYDVGEHGNRPFLVCECLEGRSLRDRLGASPLTTQEAREIALGVARALAAAHARGIVHRDLKPENLFVLSDGTVKVLDFGLATLAHAPDEDQRSIAGTPAYLAPEQLKGERADARADLFALGVILYEMLARRHPFRGSSTFETLRAILETEPRDLCDDDRIPQPLAQIAMRLLRKPREARFQSAADLAWSLEQLGQEERRLRAIEKSSRRSWIRAAVPAAIAAAAVAGAAAWWLLDTRRAPTAPPTLRFTWSLPPGVTLGSAPAVAPNGRHIAFVGVDVGGARLMVRDLDSLTVRTVSGSMGARQPFWSPDSRALGFFAAGRLMTVAWPDGAPVPAADAVEPRGGSWSVSGDIVFAPDVVLAGLSRVDATRNEIAPATQLDLAHGDTSHSWPVILPDGAHYLYFTRSADDSRAGVYVGRLHGAPAVVNTRLLASTSDVVAAPVTGAADVALFSVVDGMLEVRRLDTARLALRPDVRTLALPTGASNLYNPVMLSASADVLAYASAGLTGGNRLEIVARSGERLRLWADAEAQNWPRVSPDGVRLARQRVDPLRNNPDIWVEDLERGTQTRITTAAEPDIQPVWSPDGSALAYVSGPLPGRGGAPRRLSVAAADGTGVRRTFECPQQYCEPSDWSSDGRHLIVNTVDTSGADVWSIDVENGTATPLLAAAYNERDARLSPDGRWIAYVADEVGRPEVSVRNVSGSPRRVVISAAGGAQPVWRRDGRELFFVDPGGRLQAVAVTWSSDGGPTFGTPSTLPVPAIGFGHWGTQYDVSPSGEHVYYLPRNDDPSPREIHVVVGWRALIE